MVTRRRWERTEWLWAEDRRPDWPWPELPTWSVPCTHLPPGGRLIKRAAVSPQDMPNCFCRMDCNDLLMLYKQQLSYPDYRQIPIDFVRFLLSLNRLRCPHAGVSCDSLSPFIVSAWPHRLRTKTSTSSMIRWRRSMPTWPNTSWKNVSWSSSGERPESFALTALSWWTKLTWWSSWTMERSSKRVETNIWVLSLYAVFYFILYEASEQ